MQWRKAHFIGIGGVGMSAVASLLLDSGAAVSGSDEEVYPPISDFLKRLEQKGMKFHTPYSAENIPADADVIVIGKNAKLVPQSNTEVAAAYQSGKPVVSFPEVLAELSKDKQAVVVAGSFGKSTSAALIAHCLASAGRDPSYFIGAIPIGMPNAKIGGGELFVLEGDEYPSSNTDPRAKFLHYYPKHVLITPLAHDHFNAFPTPEDYIKPFVELMTLPPPEGTLVVCAEAPMSRDFLARASRPVVTYGVSEGMYSAGNINWGEKTSFDLYQGETLIIRLETSLLGEHNVQNIVGVAALLFSQEWVTPEQFASAVASFKGITRRLDKKSNNTSIPIYEGFGSSYDKMKSAIAAMKQHFANRRLLVVFEPNTIGWRSRASLNQYDDVFAGAAKVYVFNPPHDGKETQLSTIEIAARVSAGGIPALAIETAEQALSLLETDLQATDCILLSSSGAMGGLVQSIPKLAEQNFPSI